MSVPSCPRVTPGLARYAFRSFCHVIRRIEVAHIPPCEREPTLVHPEEKKRTLADILFGDMIELLPAQARMLQTNNPGFFYLWR